MFIPRIFLACTAAAVLAGICGCARNTAGGDAMKPVSFGKTADGTEVFLYTLKNRAGMEAKITNYGGLVVSLRVPDRNGKLDDAERECAALAARSTTACGSSR